MRVRLQGPLAEVALQHWSVRNHDDEPERFVDEYAAASLVRRLIAEGHSLGLRSLVEQSSFVHGPLDEHELVERLAEALVRGTIVAIRTPHTIMASHPRELAEIVYEPLEPEPIEELESVWLRPAADADWLRLSVSAEPESLDLETTHQHVGA
jgi:hypothetical protein